MTTNQSQPLIPELLTAWEQRIEDAGDRRPAGRLRRARFVVPVVALSLTATTALAAVAWNPIVGSDSHGRVSTATSELPAVQVGSLSVVRRPQTTADRQPRVEALLQRLYPDTQSGVRVAGVRFLADFPSGNFAILIPSETAGLNDRAHGETPKREGLCLGLGITAKGADPDELNAGYKCGDTDDLNDGRITLGAAAGGVITGLVPDGVSRVQAQTARGTLVSATVTNNVYQLNAGEPLRDGQTPQWLTPDRRAAN